MAVFGRRFFRTAAVALLAAAAFAAHADDATVTDGEIWNEGVGYYRAGDVTNALRVLRPLMLSRTHGARAAEVVAKLCHEQAHDPNAAAGGASLERLEECAAAAQIALRANPMDPRANRNFTRAVDGLAELRETRRLEGLIKASEGKDPGALMGAALAEARRLMSESASYMTNRAERAVAAADALAARAEKLADAWVPLRETVAKAVTNEEQAATIVMQLNEAQAKTVAAARSLGDLDGEGYAKVSAVEHDFNRFYKLAVMPPQAMQEDLVAQSNAWLDAERVNGRAWQPEALDFTRAFRERFPAWARAYEMQAQADTNRRPFTAEAQAKVSGLATQLEKLQIECCEKPLPPEQERALGIIREILELLPNDGGGGGGQPQPNQQPQDKDRQKQNPQAKPDEQQQDKSPEGAEGEQPEEQQPEGEQPEDGDDKDAPKDEPEEGPDDKEIEAVLKRAQERSEEHEADKRARMRKAPPPPNERDW